MTGRSLSSFPGEPQLMAAKLFHDEHKPLWAQRARIICARAAFLAPLAWVLKRPGPSPIAVARASAS